MRKTMTRIASALAVVTALGAIALVSAMPGAAQEKKPVIERLKVDEGIEKYEKVSGISGELVILSPDTLNNMNTFWVEGFKKIYPDVQFAIEGKGSSTPPAALLAGTADLGPMTRLYNEKELKEFKDKYGYEPSYIQVAIDALAVWVHKDNPVKSLTLPQVDAIFSSTRKRGFNEDITKWGQLRLDAEWKDREIVLYGRNSASGGYGFFKMQVLSKGDFKLTVKEQSASVTVVACVSGDLNAIGYSGIGYKIDGVRAVPLAAKEGDESIEATQENCYNGKYPLSRYLYIYFNKPPEKELSPLIREFLKYTLSREGQEVVVKDGFIPLSKSIVDKNLLALK